MSLPETIDGAATHPHPLDSADWGRSRYREAWERQESLVLERIAGRIGDTLVFTEHEPVFTVGVHPGADRHLIWSPDELQARGIELVRSNRGGDITYHGPGQIVGYPVIDLGPRRDLHAYLRLVEQALINSVGCLGLAADRREGKTGIWLGKRKLAAIGVACKRWVTYHGFALNVSRESPEPFAGIVPCGITDGEVTSMERELGFALDPAEVKAILRVEFSQLLKTFFAHAHA
jgi:lipoyl(octanoyl) transferase